MADTTSKGRTTGLNVEVFWAQAITVGTGGSKIASVTKGNLVGDEKLIERNPKAADNEYNQYLVPYVTELGDIAREANTVEYSAFGEATSRKATGITSLGDFTFTIALDNSNSQHDALMGLTIGTAMLIALKTELGSNLNTQGTGYDDSAYTLDVIQGTLAGRNKLLPIDGVQSVAFTVAMSTAPIIVSADDT